MPKMNRTAVSVVVAIVVITSAALIALWTFHSRAKAVQLLGDIRQLDMRRSTFRTAQDLSKKFGGHSVGPCDESKCRVDIQVPNAPLYQLGLASRTIFGVTLSIRSDRVTEVDFGVVYSPPLSQGNGLGVGVSVSDMSCYPCYEGQERYFAKMNGSQNSGTYQILVGLTAESTPEQREAAYNLDLNCMGKMSGCPDPAAVIPIVSQQIR